MQIARQIKAIGGSGTIHGAIVDIDYFDHVYVNPFDGKVTPYYALSIVDKYVYENIPSLLSAKCPELLNNLENQYKETEDKDSLAIIRETGVITTKCTRYRDTLMYRYSRIIKLLQYTTTKNIVRLWVDGFNEKPSIENGKSIIHELTENKK